MDFIYGCAISQVCWAKITETVLKMFKSKQSKKQLSDIIDKAQVFFAAKKRNLISVEWPAAVLFYYAHIVHRFLFFGSKVRYIVLSFGRAVSNRIFVALA